jgi:hypothetical protein
MDIEPITDEELARIAQEKGPSSSAATILRQLSRKRAKDRQVFAWRVVAYYFIGAAPNAETEVAMIDFVEAQEE